MALRAAFGTMVLKPWEVLLPENTEADENHDDFLWGTDAFFPHTSLHNFVPYLFVNWMAINNVLSNIAGLW